MPTYCVYLFAGPLTTLFSYTIERLSRFVFFFSNSGHASFFSSVMFMEGKDIYTKLLKKKKDPSMKKGYHSNHLRKEKAKTKESNIIWKHLARTQASFKRICFHTLYQGLKIGWTNPYWLVFTSLMRNWDADWVILPGPVQNRC